MVPSSAARSTISGRTPITFAESGGAQVSRVTQAGSPQWETVLDLDALASAEKANWVWKGAQCARPLERRCLISLVGWRRGRGHGARIRPQARASSSKAASSFPRASRMPAGRTRIRSSSAANGSPASSRVPAIPISSNASSEDSRYRQRPRSSAARRRTSRPAAACCATLRTEPFRWSSKEPTSFTRKPS